MDLLECVDVQVEWVIIDSNQTQLDPDVPDDPYAPPSVGLKVVLDDGEQVPNCDLVAVLQSSVEPDSIGQHYGL